MGITVVILTGDVPQSLMESQYICAYKKVNTFHSFLQNVQIALTMHFDLDDQRGGKTQRLSGREAKETRILE
jgi:hypothetical protein